MKRKIWLLALLGLFAVLARAYTFKVNDIWYSVISEREATVALECGNLEINPEWDLDAPARVTIIEEGDMRHKPFDEIPLHWMGNCYQGDFTVPQTVTYHGKEFTVTEVHMGAFVNCEDLVSVRFPDTVEYVGSRAFATSRVEDVEFPDDCELGPDMFIYCFNLKRVKLPKNLTKIPDRMFWWAFNDERIPIRLEGCEFVTEIGKNSFSSCGIAEYPNWAGLRKIDKYGFARSHFRDVFIPQGCILGERCFERCNSLETVDLPEDCPDNVSDIFYECPKLTLIRVRALVPPVLDNGWGEKIHENCVLEVPAESIELYRNAPYWQEFKQIQALTSGVQEVKPVSFTATSHDGKLIVNSAEEAAVYDLGGTCLHKGDNFELTLTPGMYIVSTAGESVKVQVK